MKVDPQAPRPPAPAGPRPATPSRPFEDYLAAPDRAAGFTELGMFGRAGAQTQPQMAATPGLTAPDMAPPPAADAPCTLPLPVPDKPAATPGELPLPVPEKALARPGELPLPTPDKALARPGELPLPVPRHRPLHPGQPGVPFDLRGDDRGADEAAGAARRRPPARRSATPGPSVLVAETDGAVDVVVGSRPLGDEERAQLRRLIQAILGLSGLRLAHFKLNGAREAPDFKGLEGGIHGSRPR
jgi:hypothetical protein